ncbi:MAG: division plane positioning ATPase MipZ [Alphaproteobacteria bacterium]
MAARRVTAAPEGKPHIVVIGNEKGGSGKSTTAMHLIAGLLQGGFRVGSIDLDAGQGTLTRYVGNRNQYNASNGQRLVVPDHRRIEPSDLDSGLEARMVDRGRLEAGLAELGRENAFIVIDTPGSDTALSRHAHSRADTLITPLNDSYIDLDLLADVDPDTGRVRHPSRYAEMVWEQKKARALRDGGSIDWIVMRNRMGTLESRNKRSIDRTIKELSRRIGFRLAPGFSERVVFRELFLKGLTLLDLRNPASGLKMNMSHIAARQEVRQLLQAIGLPTTE